MNSVKFPFLLIFLVMFALPVKGSGEIHHLSCEEVVVGKSSHEKSEALYARYKSNLDVLKTIVAQSLHFDSDLSRQKNSIMKILRFFVDELASPAGRLTYVNRSSAMDLKYTALNIIEVFERFYFSRGSFQGDPEAEHYLKQFQEIYFEIFGKSFYFRRTSNDPGELSRTFAQVLKEFGQTPLELSKKQNYEGYMAKNIYLLKLARQINDNINLPSRSPREFRPLVMETLNFLVRDWLPYVPNMSFSKVESDLELVIPPLDLALQSYTNSVSDESLRNDFELLSLISAYSTVRSKFHRDHSGLRF